MECCESRLLTTRRALLIGGASFAAWAGEPLDCAAATVAPREVALVKAEMSARAWAAWRMMFSHLLSRLALLLKLALRLLVTPPPKFVPSGMKLIVMT